MTISHWQRACHDLAVAKGWWDEERSFPEICMLIVCELAEAVEGYRIGDEENVAEEMADVFIRLVDVCAERGIILHEEVAKKHEKNKGRSYRHGGKKA